MTSSKRSRMSRDTRSLRAAKSPLRRASHFDPDARPDGGHATGRGCVRCLCPPYEPPLNAAQLSNLTAAWQFRGNISAKPWRPRHRSPSRIRREKAGSCRMKKTRHGFAFGSSQRNRMTLMFGAGPLLATGLKRLTQLWISHHTARRSRRAAWPHAAQVLQAPMDFTACESARRVMRIKCLKRRAFSLPPARQSAQLAFTSPQRA